VVFAGKAKFLFRESIHKEGWILPGAVVPFKLMRMAKVIFTNLGKSLWFALKI